ncbi:hypothetical protein [Spirillospora sp. CA-294931]|uniref:hypothetical protein n=1 Tax=Spirillospora sp. CA-294931 TaxID=3240042 RepID=UPI003D8F0598
MASLVDRIKAFARSPQGRQARARAQQIARDPRNKAKARSLFAKFRNRRPH